MDPLVLRLALPSLLVLLASLVQRRWGDRLGGLLAGLPLTSGTFLLLLLPTDGRGGVAEAAAGVLHGQLAVVAFATTFAWCAPRLRRWRSLACAAAVWVAVILVVGALDIPGLVVIAHVVAAVVAVAAWPVARHAFGPPVGAGAGALLGRVCVVAAVVAGLSAATGLVGAGVSGLLVAAPVVVAILAPSTQAHLGAGATRDLLRGVVLGSLAAAAFAGSVVVGVQRLGPAAFVLAAAAGLGVAGLLAYATRRPAGLLLHRRVEVPANARVRRWWRRAAAG